MILLKFWILFLKETILNSISSETSNEKFCQLAFVVLFGLSFHSKNGKIIQNDVKSHPALKALILLSPGFIFGRFSAIKTKSTWQNLEFLGKKLEFFEEFG